MISLKINLYRIYVFFQHTIYTTAAHIKIIHDINLEK